MRRLMPNGNGRLVCLGYRAGASAAPRADKEGSMEDKCDKAPLGWSNQSDSSSH